MQEDSNELARRRSLGFREAEGLADLPSILAPRTVTPAFRRMLLYALDTLCNHRFDRHSSRQPHEVIFTGIWMHLFEEWHADFPETHDAFFRYLKKWMASASDGNVLELYQLVLRHDGLRDDEFAALRGLASTYRLAYVVSGQARHKAERPTLYPIVSAEQSAQLLQDLATISEGNLGGTKMHLRRAAELLQAGKRKESVRESISAVESVARALGPSPKASLGDALDAIAKVHPLHPALKEGFKKIYGWTSDEHGIRHAALSDDDDISDPLAAFMLSACAAFCALLSVELVSSLKG